MINGILISALLVGGIGIFVGVFLGIAGKKFAVKVDEKEESIRAELPGNNCGGCGFAGCDGLAKAIAAGNAPVNGCPVGGEPVGKKIAAIMGISARQDKKMVAFVHCNGNCERTSNNYLYEGIKDCRMMQFVPTGGPKSCRYGCTGYGDCTKVCPFDAIHVINGVAVVDRDKCKACKKCIAECPKNLITLVPYDMASHVACSTPDKGKQVMDVCENGCISCKKCEKNCPVSAIVLENNIPVIDYTECIDCGKCKDDCPRKCII